MCRESREMENKLLGMVREWKVGKKRKQVQMEGSGMAAFKRTSMHRRGKNKKHKEKQEKERKRKADKCKERVQRKMVNAELNRARN